MDWVLQENPSPPPRTWLGLPAPPGTVREREPAQVVVDVLVGGKRLHYSWVPVALQFHSRRAVSDQAGRAACARLCRRRQVTLVERVGLDERGQVVTGLHEAGGLRLIVAIAVLSVDRRALAQGEVLPPEGVRPFVLAPDGDRLDIGRPQLGTSASSWAIVAGGEVIPALAKRSLRYQNPTT